jgi:hypothetical protein
MENNQLLIHFYSILALLGHTSPVDWLSLAENPTVMWDGPMA